MKCENCIHYDACKKISDVHGLAFGNSPFCDHYKDKSLFVELPCKAGTPVYVIERCRCTNVENYRLGHCHKKKQHNTPEILARVMKIQKGRKSIWNGLTLVWKWDDKEVICYKLRQKPFNLGMITALGTTVFVSREVAEDRLWEIERENGKCNIQKNK